MSKKTKYILGVLLVFVCIAIGTCVAIFSKSSMNTVINNQLAALSTDDIVKAYSYTSSEFQSATSLSDFQKFVDAYPILKNNIGASLSDHENTDGQIYVQGKLRVKDGQATPIEYLMVQEEGDWKIMGIKLTPTVLDNHTSNANAENPAPQLSQPQPLSLIYDNKDSRYSIKYPANWIFDKSGQGTVIFSGHAGTPSYYSTVNIQAVLTKNNGGQFSTTKQFMSDLKNQTIKQFSNTKFLNQGHVELAMPDGTKVKGEYLIFTSSYKGMSFKQWQIVVLRNDNQVFYAWAYTSPADQYDSDVEIAKAMLKTWAIY